LVRLQRTTPEDWSEVIVTGAVPQESIPGLIDAMDIGLMPGSNWYGSPTKILEYGAMEKPIVSARTPPIEEIVDGATEAILVDSPTGLLPAVNSILDDPPAARSRAKAFRERIAREHTWVDRGRTIARLLS
jgi:glycosyltransferase involved in cell wall biosynthesis